MLNTIFLFLLGVVLLYYGAELLVRGASSLALRTRLPKAVAGLTLVALGTSAPELFVNVLAALEGDTDFALANVSGSNLANTCLGFGICGIVGGLTIRRREFGWDVIVNGVTALAVLLCLYFRDDHAFPVAAILPLTIVFLLFCASLAFREEQEVNPTDCSPTSLRSSLIYFLAGVLSLYFGAEWVLQSAIRVAQSLAIGKDVIALTAVALGTSVPDISATLIAARRKEYGIAVGNILGSNISNIVLVLNSTLIASQANLPTTPEVRRDYLMVGLVSLVVLGVTFSIERITKSLGWGLVVGYGGYLAFRMLSLLAA